MATPRFGSSRAGFALAMAAFAFLASAARAGTIDSIPELTVEIEGVDGEWTAPGLKGLLMARDNGQGKKLGMEKAFGAILGNRATFALLKLEFDPDPFVLNNFLVTNTTPSTQIYTVTTTLPTVFGAPNFISGQVNTALVDGDNDGAMVATAAGFPIYSAQIDFADVASLQDSPFSLTVPAGGLGNDMQTFGPVLSNVAVGSSIGIQLRFSLTPGDTATILSRFDVVAVPEPASAGLLVMGCAVLVLRRRATAV